MLIWREKMRGSESGMTLVEILVVIVLISLILTVVGRSVFNQRRSRKS